MSNNLWWGQTQLSAITATTQALTSTEAIIHLNPSNRIEVYTTGATNTIAWQSDITPFTGGTVIGETNFTSGLTASTISASTIVGEVKFDTVYLTYSGTSGTTSGTKGTTLTSNGNWSVTEFSTTYFVDTKNGNITVTIPDASVNNEGKTMIFVYPRLVASNNYFNIVTTSGQFVGQYTSQKLASPDDRIEIISVPFSANGSLTYKYRVINSTISVHEEVKVSVGGNQLFSDIKSAVDFVNAYADGPRTITVFPGTYYMSATTTINCPYPISIDGYGTDTTIIKAFPTLSGNPMFEIVTSCDFNKLHMSGTTGYGLVNDECCLDCSTSGLYFEVHNCLIDGFYKGLEIEGNSSAWIIDSIIQNCIDGVYVGNGNVGMSEMTLAKNNSAVFISAATSASTFSIQNTIFDVDAGKYGITYKDEVVTPSYFFATGNAFYGDGTFLSGLTFTSATQSDIRIENNVGLMDYKPLVFLWVSGNTSATTAVTNVYVKPNVLPNRVIGNEKIKFLESATGLTYTYLPKITRRGIFTVSGDLSVSQTNVDVSVALFRNNTKLQDIDVRCATIGAPYQFAFNGINNLSQNDLIEFRFTKTTAPTSTITLRTLMLTITT